MEMWPRCLVLLMLAAGLQALAIIKLRETTYTAQEGSQFSVHVVKSGIAQSQVNVVLQLKETFNNSNEDFIGSSVSTYFGPGTKEEVQTLVFTVRDDDIPEPDEIFDLSLRVTNGDGRASLPDTAKVYISASDDAFGVFSFAGVEPVRVDELTVQNPVLLPVIRSRGTSSTVTLTYQITSSQQEAEPDQDFMVSQGTVVFLEGQNRNNLTVYVRPDNLPENDEVFEVRLVKAEGGQSVDPTVPGPSIINDQITVIIKRNDAPIRFSQAKYIVEEKENTTSIVVTVIRGLFPDDQTVVGPVETPATVDYYVTSLTAGLNQDYLLNNGSVTFTPGATRVNITALILPDNEPEVAESFQITLVNPMGAVVLSEPNITLVEIAANDEPYGILSIQSTGDRLPVFRINEDSMFQFSNLVITRTGGTFGAVSVRWEIIRNDSQPGEGDISPMSGVLKFEEGQRQNAVVLDVIQDTTSEPAERYLFSLIPSSSLGGATVAGVTQAQLIIEDSDNAYGIIQLATTSSTASGDPRVVQVAIERRGGTRSDVLLNYTVSCWTPAGKSYDAMNVSMPAIQRIPAGLASYNFSVPIRDTAFINLGSSFRVQLHSVQLDPKAEVGTYNTPRIGDVYNVTVPVTVESANGEVGFAETSNIYVDEPAMNAPPNIVKLLVKREGKSGMVTVYWDTVIQEGQGSKLTPTDIQPTSGFIVISAGESEGIIELKVLGDEEPETDESLLVNLTYVQPPSTQRLNPTRREVRVTIRENDQPGGTFQFAENMLPSYSLREDLDSLLVSVVRSGASLITSNIEYYIDPNGDTEFYGGHGVLTFKPNDTVKTFTIMPKGDEIPELEDDFVLRLRTFGQRNNSFGPFSTINISVPSNDQPYGVFQFNPLVASYYANESTSNKNMTAEVPVVRNRGRYDTVSISWSLSDLNNTDLYPLSGTLQFQPGEGEKIISLWVLPDNIPELDETFTIELSNATGGANIGTPSTAALIVRKNDDAVYFREPSQPLVTEPGKLTLTVVREGPIDRPATVKYKTRDGAATAGLDYVPIPETIATFPQGQREVSFNVTVLDDDLPEPNEPFYVDLYDPSGELVTYYAPTAVITILANDDANGMFHFVPTSTKTAQEGSPVSFVIQREKGQYGVVHIHYEVLNITTRQRVVSGEDFENSTGNVTFEDLQNQALLAITPKLDDVPEYVENFIIRLYNVSGGGPNGQHGELGGGPLNVTLAVASNDNPTGLFAFDPASLEVQVAEDYAVGRIGTTSAVLTINRMMGTFETVMVAWEIFSNQIAGGNLPKIKDLLFLADESLSVPKVPNSRRPGTGTIVAQFTGCNSCFMVVRPDYHPLASDIMDGFSISAWFQTIPHSEGYILAKTSFDGSRHFYALKIITNSTGGAVEFRYSVIGSQNNHVEAKTVAVAVQNGAWHQVVVTIEAKLVAFYIDGVFIGESTFQGRLVDDGGVLYIGAMAPGTDFFTGYLQDVRLYSRRLELGEISELYETPSRNDIVQISGYVMFGEGQKTGSILVQTVDDTEEESNEVFSVKLISAKGGATIKDTDDKAVLTVLKSDNANGLFGFLGSCQPSTIQEGQNLTCTIERQRGDSGVVDITWALLEPTPNGPKLAFGVLVNATGQLVFPPGVRSQSLVLEVTDDDVPELSQQYELRLMFALARDGPGSTNTSGASINPTSAIQRITLSDSDYPYGFMQFAKGPPPSLEDPMVPLSLSPLQESVREEVGYVSLLVVRAQGLIGDISVEWRTDDDTARSAGKTPPDYVARVDRVSLAEGQRYAYINITILDNAIPENEKRFSVKLLNGRGGAETGPGSEAIITIQPSDQAFGVFQFAHESLTLSIPELENVTSNTEFLKVERLGGSIGAVNLTWKVEDRGSDFLQNEGVLSLMDGQTTANLDLRVRGDSIPELDETFVVKLMNVTKGSLGDEAKTESRVTIEANDDPYGVLIITDRPTYVNESNTTATIRIQRQTGSGQFGSVNVTYRTLSPLEIYTYLPGGVSRAGLTDYVMASGSAVMGPGIASIYVNISIRDDEEPEVDETVFVILTGVTLLEPAQPRPVQGSPRLGQPSNTYGQVIIRANDYTNGILQLSVANVTVSEDQDGPFIYVSRTAGLFGQVSVKFEVIAGTATSPEDYTVGTVEVFLANGEQRRPVPVEIVNDLVPEVAETFTVRLLNQTTGGAVLGPLREAVITIEKSDDPNGAFAFEITELSSEEPEGKAEKTVEIPVVRYGGTLGVIGVQWQVSLNGDVTDGDIYPTSGYVYFVSNEARQLITINVLPDDIPEGVEDVVITLLNATNGGNIDINKRTFTLHIYANDNPHGMVELASSNSTLLEQAADSRQFINVSRIGGTVGQLLVYFNTKELDLLTVIKQDGETVFDYFDDPLPGRLNLPVAGTRLDVSGQPNPRLACATACFLSEACLSFDFNASFPDCNWFTVGDTTFLIQRSGYEFYHKRYTKATALYGQRAEADTDYVSVKESSIIIPDGARQGGIPLIIKADLIPELNEMFLINLTKVELLGIQASNPQDIPKLGPLRTGYVTIAKNDDANGVFRLYSNDPRALQQGQLLLVEERNQLAVELIIARQGGTIGQVSVSWAVNMLLSTATRETDYRADGATLTFQPGETQKTITISIVDDVFPENDENIVVELTATQGGATIGPQNQVTVTIMANDYVAGLLAFNPTAYLVKEGSMVIVNVTRSAPALGDVSANWTLVAVNSQPASVRFATTYGTLYFAKRVLQQQIALQVLADYKPKINQEYRVEIINITTDGIRETGAAALDPQHDVAIITIEGGNEPHGVFSFAANSISRRVAEASVAIQLNVDRKFGAIGEVDVFYDIKAGSATPLSEMLQLATGGSQLLSDFMPVINGKVTFADGQNSGTIQVLVYDDDIAEVDEVFLVNITRVQLTTASPTDPFIPKLGSSTLAEVIIEANDGTHGELVFLPGSDVVFVDEKPQNVSLVITRSRGTFGHVSVFCFAQSPPDGATRQRDFLFEPDEIEFVSGESEKVIVVTILDDDEPEPKEDFEIILASPKNGVQLGFPHKAVITISASDEAGGLVTFESSDEVTVNEPVSVGSQEGKAELRVRRGPGMFGVVNVPFRVITSDGKEGVTDIYPTSGYVTFRDKEGIAVLTVSAVADNEPEEKESFIVELMPPDTGATLGAVTRRLVSVERNDAPYGLVEIFPASIRNRSSIDVEENVGLVYFDVVRSRGSLERISVDIVTRGVTAQAQSGRDLMMVPVQQIQCKHNSGWYSYSHRGDVYVVMLNDQRTGDLTSRAGSDGADTPYNASNVKQSVLYRWQGTLVPVQTIETNTASAATSFIMSNQTYLFITNRGSDGKYETYSRLYRVNSDGSLLVVQDLVTRGASDVQYFTHNSQSYILIANSRDNTGQSSMLSDIYQWDMSGRRFISVPVQQLTTRGAAAASLIHISDVLMLVIANHVDSNGNDYEINSVVYKMDINNRFTIHQQIPSKGAADVATFTSDGMYFMVLCNQRDSMGVYQQETILYKWDQLTSLFNPIQELDTVDCQKLHVFTGNDGNMYLSVASGGGPSLLLQWQDYRFNLTWSGPAMRDLYPLIIPNRDTPTLTLLEGKVANDSMPLTSVFQMTSLDRQQSDYVFRSEKLTFTAGQTVMQVSTYILDDDIPEDTESFVVELANPREGAEIGPSKEITVNILANDDGHGIIAFSNDSREVFADEIDGRENVVQLNVVRQQGAYGRVVVRWQASGQHNGIYDITPVDGRVEFADGQTIATISITIRDDNIPELDELSNIQLIDVVEPGTRLVGKGARIGKNAVCKLTVLANDSPHGVIAWENLSYQTVEPEGTDSAVTLTIIRQQGSLGQIRISFSTQRASDLAVAEQAISGEDYVAVQTTVDMLNNVTKAQVYVPILADSIPEIAEKFLVVLTGVQLVGEAPAAAVTPSVRNTGRIATVTIAENDNARGIVEFKVNRNSENRVDVYESVGTVQLAVSRTVGRFGDVQVTWQAIPREATTEDFQPAGGTIILAAGAELAYINISIIDDDIPEGLQTFDVKLTQVTAGGAALGTDTVVRVGILRNDSPTGIFSFVSLEKSVHEARTENDPQGMVTLDVYRQGTEGVVNVIWRLSSDAAEDFLPPLTGSLTFGQGESYKTVTLRTKPDSILEGEERYTVSLVSASNDADISPTQGDATIIILADPGASGSISINPNTRSLVMGEPSANYSGKAEVRVDRDVGVFGTVRVTWQIVPRLLDTFIQQQGELMLVDKQTQGTIEIQTIDDNAAELRQMFTLELTSATGGATINPTSRTCEITVTASDYPHGLFQFAYPPEVTVSESDGQVLVVVERMFGGVGQVRVSYTTYPGTARSALDAEQDFIPNSGTLIFNNNERSKNIYVDIVNDNIAEGPESFYVNLTRVELLQPSNNNYTRINGLQLDMAPDLGTLKVKEVIIDKNDDAEGIVQFAADAVAMKVSEESGVAQIPLERGPGSYGDVSVLFTTKALSATANVDFLLTEGNVTMRSGISRLLINITIIDDSDREFEEDFEVTLTNVLGGAKLGSRTRSVVTIMKSDYPNGMFSFRGDTMMAIPNPDTSRTLTLTMERTGGLLGKQTLYWRIHGPNDPNKVLQETNDVSFFNPTDGREVTQGQLVWGNNEAGAKSFELNIKGRTGWEIAKSFIIVIYDIQGFPATSGNGEPSPTAGNFTLTIEKYGDPNGIVRFDGEAQSLRTFDEPEGSQERKTLEFPIYRREGTTGNIRVHWRITGPVGQNPDFDPMEGVAVIEGDKRNGLVTFALLGDNEPEVDERFSLKLTEVEGGAELDNVFTTSNFVIRFNDFPNGKFSLPAAAQQILVSPSDLQRQIRLNITRSFGTVGRVRVSYTSVYDQAQAGVLYLPTSGSVTLEDGERYGIVLINIENSVYISPRSTFTVTLTAAQFIGIGMLMPPELINDERSVKVPVPDPAANSDVGFHSNIFNVDEGTNLVDLKITRYGSYGRVQVDWRAGYPQLDQPPGYTPGIISPETGFAVLENAINSSTSKIQLTVDRELRPELFAVHLPSVPVAQAVGGAKLRSGYTLAKIEPYGVIRFSPDSRNKLVAEPEGKPFDVSLTIERLYGSLDSIQVRYRTYSDSATGGLDYVNIDNGAINMEPASTAATIYVQILPDNIPEENEKFYVNLTAVSRLPTDTTQNISPRLSTLYWSATVTILRNNDPYGVLSIAAKVQTDRVGEPSIVELAVTRTGGAYGIVTVEVRTVGGGEPWDHEVAALPSVRNDTIGQALGNRDLTRRAVQGQDYNQLSTVITLQSGETSKMVTLTILDDLEAEDDEDVFVYLIPRTDGVRVAEPLRDNGRAGYAKVVIGRNDNWNGWIGFYAVNSSVVTGNEDKGLNPRLTIERKNAAYGDLTVIWKARTSQLEDTVKSEALDLTSKLAKVTDDVVCPARQTFCVFEVPLEDDNVPENSTSFVVELVQVSAGAVIDQARRFATVTLQESDSPNGRIQFSPNSRVVYIGLEQVSVVLEVERVGYEGKLVTVGYSSLQVPGTVSYVAGVRVSHAVPGADFYSATGQLTFLPGQKSQSITVSLDPLKASSIPYPKMFQVSLSDVTNGAELGEYKANVTIVAGDDRTVWNVWPSTQLLNNNASIEGVMEKLQRVIQGKLSQPQIAILQNILDQVMAQFQDQILNQGARSSIMSVFCSLLDPTRDDATRGATGLAAVMEKFAFNYMAQYQCDTCCSQSTLVYSPECPYVQFGVAKWYPENINGYTYEARSRDTYRVADNLLSVQDIGRNSPSPRCEVIAFIDYSSSIWFIKDSIRMLSDKVFTVSVENMESRYVSQPAIFRVHTNDGRVANKKAQCMYYDEGSSSWTSDDGVCRVVNNLQLAVDDYVECACHHMSHYTVITHAPNPNLIGYPVWFYISCFFCMTCMAITILCHHTCVVNGMFASNLIMHMCFAVFATELCYVIDAYLSPAQLLGVSADSDNYRCIVMSLFLHYFFLAQFTWMLVQAVNFWKILVLNDEHTERKYVFYFLLGWGLPTVIVAVFYIVAYCVYRYTTDLPYHQIYGDVNGNEDICFVTNAFVGLAGVISPSFLCLMIAGIIFVQAFQVQPQWQAYDDIYKGRYNIIEIRTLLLFWAFILITWLWGGLHMVYSQLWMLVLFCIFNIMVGLFAVIVYAILRNPCLPCFGPKKATYSINLPHSEIAGSPHNVLFNSYPDSIKGSKASLLPEVWDNDSVHNGQHDLQVKRSAANGNIYVIPPYDKRKLSEDKESQDFDELIYALKTGIGYSPSDNSNMLPPELDPGDSFNSQYDLRRINIADTHL